jgi:glucokinase
MVVIFALSGRHPTTAPAAVPEPSGVILPVMDLYGGIDLGGTFIKAAALDAAGTIRGRAMVPTAPEDGQEMVLERLAGALDEAVRQAGGHLVAAGVGVPGLVDNHGTILRFPNFEGWDGYRLAPALRQRIGRPIVIENDANAAAVAEGVAGAAGRYQDFVFVTLGTGVGAGIVLAGRIHRGSHGKAAELGHVKVVSEGHLCGCGARGCVEQYASGTALARAAGEAVARGQLPPPGDGESLTPEWLHHLARRGHDRAREIYTGAGDSLGQALAAVVNLLDITVFFIGGGVAGAFDLLHPALVASIRRHAFGLDPGDLVVARATCGNDAGMLGAAHLARQSVCRTPPPA